MSGLGESRSARGGPEAVRLPGLTDEELVARAQSGERAALPEIYRRHVDGVHRRLSRLIGPDPEREDLLQQVFIETFRSLARFRGEARFATYLYRVTTNIAYDHLKRRSRRDEVLSDEIGERPGVEPTPEAIAIRRHEIDRAWRCLDRLKPKKRVAFLLRVVEGLSIEEIAEQVNAEPAAVSQRILYAQRELVAMMRRGEKEPT